VSLLRAYAGAVLQEDSADSVRMTGNTMAFKPPRRIAPPAAAVQ
jgi:hypothetical protein